MVATVYLVAMLLKWNKVMVTVVTADIGLERCPGAEEHAWHI